MADEQLILVRLAGELGIKSRRVRSRFQRRLAANIKDALASTGEPYDVKEAWERLYVRTPSAEAAAALQRVFGISSISPVDAAVGADLDKIVETGADLYRDRVRGRKYAVRARRSGEHAFNSQDVEIQLGTALNEGAEVDLDDPDVTVHVEVRHDDAYLFSDRLPGAGGLPVGTEGRAVMLISGGYDSAAAAWRMLRRGVALDYVFCNLGGDAYERAVAQVAKVLADDWSYGTHPRLFVVDFDEPVNAMKAAVKDSYWQLVLKRLMYRAASRIAADTGAEAIVTGEALGQVSSQTLANLRALEPAAELPVFRPLLGFDKYEIIQRARQIGTASLSEKVKEYCAIAPGRPVTAASVEAVDAQEADMDPKPLADAVANKKELDLRALEPTDLVAPYLFTTDIPGDAIVLDCRPESQYRGWHVPGAERRDEWELLTRFNRLDRDRTYVLYCAHGVQTAYLAERMQRDGYEAYSFRGGLRGIMKWANERGVPAEEVLR